MDGKKCKQKYLYWKLIHLYTENKYFSVCKSIEPIRSGSKDIFSKTPPLLFLSLNYVIKGKSLGGAQFVSLANNRHVGFIGKLQPRHLCWYLIDQWKGADKLVNWPIRIVWQHQLIKRFVSFDLLLAGMCPRAHDDCAQWDRWLRSPTELLTLGQILHLRCLFCPPPLYKQTPSISVINSDECRSLLSIL